VLRLRDYMLAHGVTGRCVVISDSNANRPGAGADPEAIEATAAVW